MSAVQEFSASLAAGTRQQAFARLRERYPVFRYESCEWRESGEDMHLTFRFAAAPDLQFESHYVLERVPSAWRELPHPIVDHLVFHIGLVESLSYWKATASPAWEVAAGALSPPQQTWWLDLLHHGMGEFFYVNQIDHSQPDLVTLRVTGGDQPGPCGQLPLPDRSLVPLGGGRDSALTARLLQEAGLPFGCMMLNPIPAAERVAAAVGDAAPVIVRRRLDARLLELNRLGFLNGHTPFSACLAFTNALCLALYGYRYIVIANEQSSNQGNVTYLGREINHQYSKSFRFEQQFDEYLQKYLLRNGHYFSFLRPLYELQIGQAFAKCVDLLPLFRSCNRGQKDDAWCGACPKCLSVYMTTYPFLTPEQRVTTFGRDLFDQQAAIPILRELTGLEPEKPFECVCTREEGAASLFLAIQACRQQGLPLPIGLQYAAEHILVRSPEAPCWAQDLLHHYGREHGLPPAFDQVLRRAVEA